MLKILEQLTGGMLKAAAFCMALVALGVFSRPHWYMLAALVHSSSPALKCFVKKIVNKLEIIKTFDATLVERSHIGLELEIRARRFLHRAQNFRRQRQQAFGELQGDRKYCMLVFGLSCFYQSR